MARLNGYQPDAGSTSCTSPSTGSPIYRSDIVSHPDHYCFSKFEPKDVIREWGLNFNLGNVVKYIVRNGKKNGNSNIQDLKKAKQYLEFEIEFLEKQGD